jgi:type IV pilus assembly protein PilP
VTRAWSQDWSSLAGLAALLLVGCGGPPPKRIAPPLAGTTSKPAADQVSAAAGSPDGGSAADAPPEWSYSSTGKRDPFRPYLAELGSSTGPVMTRCNTPLGQFELEQLKLVAVITGLADPVAMVEAPNGVGYSLRKGACLGKNGGVVAAVRTGEVLVTEWMQRADGTRDRTQTVLKLPKEAALNLEE